MMINSYLGQRWSEVSSELRNQSRSYRFKVALPRGKVKVKGDLRVVRVREDSGQLEFVLAHESFVKNSE